MKIEHWRSQGYDAEQLDYGNLLGACMGNEGSAARDQHCDTRKAGQNLSRNPANPSNRVEDIVQFLGDGRITSSDPIFDSEINAVLNLNLAFLKNNRKAVLDAFKQGLGSGQFSRRRLERILQAWNGESDTGDLNEFCQVVVYYLRKRLSRS